MALTATASQGFEFVRNVSDYEIMWVPGDPGDALDIGDLLNNTNGVMDQVGDSGVPLARVEKKVTIPSATTVGFPTLGESDMVTGWGQLDNNLSNTLVPVRPLVAPGTPIYKCTFSGHADDTVAAYSATTPSITLTTALGGDDDPNGALIYVYEGAGKGQWNIAADYANGTKVLTLHRKFETALDTTSKVIILEGEGGGAARGIGVFGRIDCLDHDTLDASDGANDGDWIVFLDAREIKKYLSVLMLPVVPAGSLLMA